MDVLGLKMKRHWNELLCLAVSSESTGAGADVFIASSPGTQRCPAHPLDKYLLNKQINK